MARSGVGKDLTSSRSGRQDLAHSLLAAGSLLGEVQPSLLLWLGLACCCRTALMIAVAVSATAPSCLTAC